MLNVFLKVDPPIRLPVFIIFLFNPISLSADSLQRLFKQVNPSVVLVTAEQRDISGIPGDRRPVLTQQVGTGVLISKQGLVVTASHVVHTADRVIVQFLDGKKIRARIIRTEPEADLALLKLKLVPKQATVASLANSDSTKTGEQVFVIGAPYGVGHSITSGIISARHNAGEINNRIPLGELFQTDTAINVGHSGGPLFNMNGEVIGIISHILSMSGGYDGIGFAVTSNTVKELLMSSNSIWTGLQGYPLDETLASIFNLPQAGGLLVEKVAKGSISHRLGLKAGAVNAKIEGKSMIVGGDIVLGIMDIPLHGENYQAKVRERMGQLIKGDKIYVQVLRKGEVIWLSTDYSRQ
ncbi:MAG: S1C family serine protease [Gammaproteobacteria bacterium]